MQEVKELDLKQDQIVSLSIPIKKRSVIQCVNDKLGDQDFMQKVGMAPVVALEMYRVIVSSFLVLFVPQKCDDHVCTLSENMVLENELYSAGLVFNFITMASFLAMYTLEVKRENRLITYLEVNSSVPSDNSSVGLTLEQLPTDKRDSILTLDRYYQYSGWSSIILFIINTILSGFVVYNYYLDSQTTSTYITNILFMVTKLADVHSNVNTEKNVFYSAYLKGKVQYNDVDPDKIPLVPDTISMLLDKPLKIEDYTTVPGIDPPLNEEKEDEEKKEYEEKKEDEDGKIIVTIHDISSNPSSSTDLQSLDNQV